MLDTSGLSALGPPDLNGLAAHGMASVQGYTSLVDGPYATATGAHDATGQGQDTLSLNAIGNGTLDELDTSVLLTLPAYLTTAPQDGGRTGGATGGLAGTGRRDIGAGKLATWYLGESVAVSKIEVPDPGARADVAAGVRIGLTAPDGSTRWFRVWAANPGTLEVTLPAPVMTTTILARAGHAATSLGAPSAVERNGQVLAADGQLQGVLIPPRWNFAGFDGTFAVFADRLASGPLTVESVPGGAAAGATVHYVRGAGGNPVRASVSSAHGVRLVRSVAAIPGWSATWQPRIGPAVTLPVLADGLVQVVDVPAGQGMVTWHYTAPRFTAGLALSCGAALLVVLLALLALGGGRAGRTPRWPRRDGGRRRNRRLAPDRGLEDRAGYPFPRGVYRLPRSTHPLPPSGHPLPRSHQEREYEGDDVQV